MDPQIWLALITLTSIEIVLGIDNIIFIAIIAGRLPVHQQAKGRTIGLLLAMLTRIALLFSLTLIMRLTAPLFILLGQEISGRDIILILGGLFLLGKSTLEIPASYWNGSYGRRTGLSYPKGLYLFRDGILCVRRNVESKSPQTATSSGKTTPIDSRKLLVGMKEHGI